MGRCVICNNEFEESWLISHRKRLFCKDCIQVQLRVLSSLVPEKVGMYKDTQEMLAEIAAWRYIVESWIDSDKESFQTTQPGGAS